MITILSTIFVLGLLLLVHELGHFLMAKLSGVEVQEFGFGFPPRLLTLFERAGTKYTLNIIPVGGFVRLLGQDDPEVVDGFASQSKRVRVGTLVAGPAMNILLAFSLFTGALIYGVPVQTGSGVQILEVNSGSPAEEVGLEPGDLVLRIDGVVPLNPEHMVAYSKDRLGQEVNLVVERKGEVLALGIVPRTEWPEGQGPMGVTISTRWTTLRYPLGQALIEGAHETGTMLLTTFWVPIEVIRGRLPTEAIRPVGPAGVYRMTAEAASQVADRGWWFPLLQRTAVFSTALAITNLLPLPALDGGRLMFILVEAIRGKRLDPEKEGLAHLVGMAILLALMVLITYSDITSPISSIDWNLFGF